MNRGSRSTCSRRFPRRRWTRPSRRSPRREPPPSSGAHAPHGVASRSIARRAPARAVAPDRARGRAARRPGVAPGGARDPPPARSGGRAAHWHTHPGVRDVKDAAPILSAVPAAPADVGLVIGPEGGLDPKDLVRPRRLRCPSPSTSGRAPCRAGLQGQWPHRCSSPARATSTLSQHRPRSDRGSRSPPSGRAHRAGVQGELRGDGGACRQARRRWL